MSYTKIDQRFDPLLKKPWLRSPTQGLSTRTTIQDEVFQGITVPKGSLLHLRFGAANVDPDEWANPFELNLERKAPTRHLYFQPGRGFALAQVFRDSSSNSHGISCSIAYQAFATARTIPLCINPALCSDSGIES